MGYVYKVPFGKERVRKSDGDCVIRAIAFACTIDKSWVSGASLLFEKSLELQDGPQQRRVYEAVLKDSGYVHVPVRDSVTVRDLVAHMMDDVRNDKVRVEVVIKVRHHLLYAVNGDYYDTFDTGGCRVLCYWVRASIVK